MSPHRMAFSSIRAICGFGKNDKKNYHNVWGKPRELEESFLFAWFLEYRWWFWPEYDKYDEKKWRVCFLWLVHGVAAYKRQPLGLRAHFMSISASDGECYVTPYSSICPLSFSFANDKNFPSLLWNAEEISHRFVRCTSKFRNNSSNNQLQAARSLYGNVLLRIFLSHFSISCA